MYIDWLSNEIPTYKELFAQSHLCWIIQYRLLHVELHGQKLKFLNIENRAPYRLGGADFSMGQILFKTRNSQQMLPIITVNFLISKDLISG
jgi:hypothetical protein